MSRRTRRCRNCPDSPQAPALPIKSVQIAEQKPVTILSPKIIDSESEGLRLWNHVLFGTFTCVDMIAGYANLGMPGDPAPKIRDLIGRLTAVLKQVENKNANPCPKQCPSPSPSDGPVA